MDIKGIESISLSEESKKALQSETWREVRSCVEEEKKALTDTRTMDVTEGDEPDSVPNMTGEDVAREPEAPAMPESNGIDVQDGKTAKQRAEEKLKKEMAEAKDKSFAKPIIGYLLERCREDEGLAQDVVQGHKTWQKCFDYIYGQARKRTKGNCAAIREDVVYEWAEDYYHKDDKEEEERKAKKAAEVKAKKVKYTAEKKTPGTKGGANKAERKAPDLLKDQIPKESPKHKKSGKEMDGQMDMFSMLGM